MLASWSATSGFPGHFPHIGGHDEEAADMRGLILGLIWLAAGAAQADVYISIDAKGGYVLTNVHRPGRHYQRVISEPLARLASTTSTPSDRPLMMRLRRGKLPATGPASSGNSETTAPPCSTMACAKPRWRCG